MDGNVSAESWRRFDISRNALARSALSTSLSSGNGILAADGAFGSVFFMDLNGSFFGFFFFGLSPSLPSTVSSSLSSSMANADKSGSRCLQ